MPWWVVFAIILALILVGLAFLLKFSSHSAQPTADKTGLFSKVQPFLTNFDSAVGMRQRSDRYYYVWAQLGRVWRVDVQTGARSLVLDKYNDVAKVYDGPFNFGGDERGLLGIAFNPSNDNEVFVAYSAPKTDAYDSKTNHIARLSRFTVEDKDGLNERFVNEQIVLDIPQQEAYHHAQSLEFGPADNFLYYSVGDGGPQADPLGHAQNPFELRGKILRLDVNKRNGEKKQYSIPPTNPFADGKQGAPEVIALGLRNPWRFSIERGNRMFIADVGNNSQESIKILQLPSSPTEPLKPVNFGWAVYEGDEKTGNAGNAALSVEPWTKPSFTYKTGGPLGRAVVGGFLLPPATAGRAGEKERYLFADYVSGNLVVIEQPEKEGEQWKLVSVTPPEQWFSASPAEKQRISIVPTQQPVTQQFIDARKNISALARDTQGNIYVLVWTQTSTGDGRTAIYRL